MNQNEITAADAVASKLDRELYPAICVDLYQSNGWIPVAIDEALANHPETAETAKKMYSEIEEIFARQLEPKILELVRFLEGYPMQLTDIPEDN